MEQITTDVPLSRLADVLNTALDPMYGGCWYWADVAEMIEPSEVPAEIRDEWAPYTLIAWPLSPGGAVIIVDVEDPDGERFRLDLDAIRRGLATMATKFPKHFGDLMGETDDANTGDCLVQCALFGDEIYG